MSAVHNYLSEIANSPLSVPLCYVYPAMLHYKACARTRKQKVADIALMVFGLIAAAYTTIQTINVCLLPLFHSAARG